MSDVAHASLVVLLSTGVILATVPVLAGLYQFLVLGFSRFESHLEDTADVLPRVSILIPAWNEAAVIQATMDRLLKLDYPKDRLRIWVVDDASNDGTDHLAIEASKIHPGQIRHIRRVAGGEGKAHTLNYGLDVVLAGEWTEAILIMDADVIYTKSSLKKMARHLADDSIGAVTAYIKEGSRKPSALQRYIGFEYITATGASRRAQNVLGFLACLSGGAQLHSRENMIAIGGQIFSDTLAEDTFTTFRTQLSGRKAIFEPNAIVYAEEPDSIEGLWKQRIRWGRGNVQITQVFKNLWFNKKVHAGLGSVSMGILWFSIFLMPVFQTMASIGLLGLYFLSEAELAWTLFRFFWILAAIVYATVTTISMVLDVESAKRTWLEGILFPGAVSLTMIVYSVFPSLFAPIVDQALVTAPGLSVAVPLFSYSWLVLAMAVAYGSKWIEVKGGPTWLSRTVLLLGGYGPFLCAVTVGSYLKEISGASMTWDKTEKTGKVA